MAVEQFREIDKALSIKPLSSKTNTDIQPALLPQSVLDGNLNISQQVKQISFVDALIKKAKETKNKAVEVRKKSEKTLATFSLANFSALLASCVACEYDTNVPVHKMKNRNSFRLLLHIPINKRFDEMVEAGFVSGKLPDVQRIQSMKEHFESSIAGWVYHGNFVYDGVVAEATFWDSCYSFFRNATHAGKHTFNNPKPFINDAQRKKLEELATKAIDTVCQKKKLI